MKISYGNSRMDKKWKNREISWEDFKSKVSVTQRTTETVEEFLKMKRGDQDRIKDIGGFVGGHLRNGKRKTGMVLCRSMLTLDMDFGIPGIADDIDMLFGYECCLYSTHKHTPQKPRLRLIIPISRDVTEEEYPAVARMVAREIGIDLFDDTTYQPHRLMFWPSTPADGEFVYKEVEGEILNPDDYLAMYDDWRDVSTWPVSSRQSEIVKREVKEQADPLTKEGTVGAFCRAYSIHDVMEAFLSERYAPSAMEGRYDYIPGEGSAGVQIFDDKFAYSHHATDPAGGKLLNAFDLVRIHLFGDRDDRAKADTAPGSLPSFKAMCEFAVKDEKVKRQIAADKKEEAGSDFQSSDDDEAWKAGLQYDARTLALKNNLHNLRLILENDPNLQSLVFNRLADGMEIKGEVPWKHPAKFWRDADDSQLICYIDANYGTFSQSNYMTAVTKVTDDRSYHPVLEYLNDLPEWDGVERADTLLIDYLGAEDTPYVRAVTRKTLCAAIVRVLNPGCKFDTMLVLNGDQGIGKSTLIRKLGGEWFSDSLSLSDTKDKTAAEKLQGFWILEIGELAGLRKAEVETLRSFLSRQDDVYRASYGRRATPHPRQCVFIGTTNAQNGYLRDTTGNRRFWPVVTPGSGSKHTWQMTEEDVRQIWAEIMVRVKAGEKLYLSADEEKLAKEEQLAAMETDDREGIVKNYLERLLPEDWEDKELYDRRAFLNNTEFGGPIKGTVQRERVCTMEIWCECFEKERSNMNRTDSNTLTAMLLRLGWIRQPKKGWFKLYGQQFWFARPS